MVSRDCLSRRGALALAACHRLALKERLTLERHLRKCPGCRQELRELRQTADVLAVLGTEPAAVAHAGADRPGLRQSALRRPRLYWLVPGALAAAAGATTAAFLLLTAGHPSASLTLHGRGGVVAQVQLTSEQWGTDLSLDVQGQRAGSLYTVYLESTYGLSWPVGSYRATSGTTEVHFSCALTLQQVSRLVVERPSGVTVLRSRVAA